MGYQTITAKPVSGALGALIEGVDLSRDLDNQTASDVHQALLDHCVIFFRDQLMSPEQHRRLARRFGPLSVHECVDALPGHPEVIVVVKDKADTVNFGGGWHSDMTFFDAPALGSILYAPRSRLMAATPCSPISIWPTRHCRRVCSGCSTGWSRCIGARQLRRRCRSDYAASTVCRR